jgi:hypothetical protein
MFPFAAVALVAAACASQNSDSGQRLAGIEGRLAQLESRLGPDASPAPEAPMDSDAGTEVLADASIARVVKHAGAGTPTERVAACKSAVEQQCAEQVREESVQQRRKENGGFAWVERDVLPRADSTPQGRACVQRMTKECDTAPPRDKRLEWLDAQLAPGKKDEKLTREIRGLIAKKTGARPEALDVECATQFCRMDAKLFERGPIALLDLDNHFDGGMTSDGRYWYATRRGYQLSSGPSVRNPYWGRP